MRLLFKVFGRTDRRLQYILLRSPAFQWRFLSSFPRASLWRRTTTLCTCPWGVSLASQRIALYASSSRTPTAPKTSGRKPASSASSAWATNSRLPRGNVHVFNTALRLFCARDDEPTRPGAEAWQAVIDFQFEMHIKSKWKVFRALHLESFMSTRQKWDWIQYRKLMSREDTLSRCNRKKADVWGKNEIINAKGDCFSQQLYILKS